MNLIRRAILAFALIAGMAPAFAQAPPPVPALPDAERRTSYTISSSTCACSVGFALYGDSTDFQNWVEVYVNGVRVNYNDATNGWTITSPTGSLASIPRPVTDGVLTFTNAQTGTIQIVGAERPRRTAQFAENRGVAARDLNYVLTYVVASLREFWDKLNDVTGRTLQAPPGETVTTLPSATSRAGALLAFDGSGNPVAVAPGVGTGNVIGPVSSTNGDVACFNGTTGAIIKDCGAIGTTTLTGDITGGPAVGTLSTTLATVNPTPGTYGSASQVPVITVNGKGLTTASTPITITPAAIGAVPTTRQIVLGTGMVGGGPLSSDVTIGLATIPNNTIIANNSGGTGVPSDLSASQVLDMLGAVQGDVLYRSSTGWNVLAPGTSGQLLTTNGVGANPSWTTASGTGTVTSVTAGTGITTSPTAGITGSGSISITAPVTSALGGTGVVSPATHTIPINQGSSAQANTGTGTTGQCVVSQGASADPAYKSGCRVLLNTLTASNSATLSDTTSLTSTYNDYEIVFTNILPASNNVSAALVVHSGGSFQITNYISNVTSFSNGSATVNASNPTTDIPLSVVNLLPNTGHGLSGIMRVSNVAGTSTGKLWAGTIHFDGVTLTGTALCSGYWANAAAIDGFQIFMSTGNITSGTVKIYGIL